MTLLLRLLAVWSFLGGPLILTGFFKPRLGQQLAFGTMFLPVLLLMVGGWSLGSKARAGRLAGIAGAILLLLEQSAGAWLMLQHQTPAATFGLNLSGLIVGTASAVLFLYLNLRTGRPVDAARELAQARQREQVRDYLLLVCSGGFVAGGLFMVYAGKLDVGISSIVFFGACGLVPILRLRRKRREARALAAGTVVPIALPADGTLRPLRRTLVTAALTMLVIGSVLLYFGAPYPPLIRVLAGSICGLAVVLLVLCAVGKLPAGHLRFDPDGLALGRRGFELFVPWSAIRAVSVVEYVGNPGVAIDLHDDEAVQAPADRLGKVHAELRRNRSWAGTPLLILTSPYAVGAPDLALTIQERLR